MRLTVILLLLLSACARPPQAVWTKFPTAGQLLDQLHRVSGRFRSLDAAAKVSLSVHGKRFSSQQFLLVERPDRVRADVLSGFGQPLLQLTSDGRQLAVFLNTETPGHFFRGPATDANIARFTRLPLATKSLIRLLLYDPPLIDDQQGRVEPQDGQLRLSLESSTRRQELLFDRQLRLVGCRYLAGEDLLLEVQYREIGADGYPRQMELNLVREETTATLRFADVKTNVSIAAGKFELRKPARLDVEPLP